MLTCWMLDVGCFLLSPPQNDLPASSKLALLSLILLQGSHASLLAAQLDILEIPGTTLRDNPLGDPLARQVALFKPDTLPDDQPATLVVYLPGWGGSSEGPIAEGRTSWFGGVVDHFATTTPVRIAVVDGRSRYGGSQFLNSTATGPYADYVAAEILPALTAKYASAKTGPNPIIAGHSSGGYGALLLAIRRHDTFPAVVALSPDSDFATTHKPFTEQPSARAVTPADLDAAMAPSGSFRLPADGLVRMLSGPLRQLHPHRRPARPLRLVLRPARQLAP